jgi:activator of HSP90 ATPase
MKTATIEQKVTIPKTTPQQVYEAYTNPEIQTKFTDSKATGKAKVGEKFTAWDGYIFGKYLELETGKRVVQEWSTDDWDEGYQPSKLTLTFTQTSKGTEIHLVQTDVPADQKHDFEDGWTEFYWTPLKEYFKK